MKASSPSLNGNPETDLNNTHTPSSLVRLGEERKVTMKEFELLLFMTTIIGSLLFAIWFNLFLFEIEPFVRAWGRKNISKIWDRLKRIVKR